MRITTSKSKNSESFYITQSYTNAEGKSTSKTIRKLGTLAELSEQLHTDRDGVVEWANEQARLETLKYKSEKEDATVMIPFHSNRLLDYNKQKLFSGGYLFLQSIYYGLKLDSICRKMTEYYRGMKTICPEYHEASRPWYAELEAVSRCILWSRITECPVMICHLSIPEGAEQIKKEKEAGNKFIFAETCAHYLLFDTDTLKKYGAFARCNPPLRSPERREKLWEYVLNGTIEVIGSDHAAYTHEEKQAAENIFDAPCGFPGLQTILPGLLTEGVIKRGMSLVDFARLTSTNAAKRFGLYPKKGHIAVGADADFAIISLNHPWKYDHTKSFSKGKSNGYPQENMSFEAKVEKTMVRGEVVYQSEKIVKPKGYGQWLC